MKIKSYNDIEKLGNLLKESDLVVDLSECELKTRTRVLDFITGITFYNGSIKKIDKDNFNIKLNREG